MGNKNSRIGVRTIYQAQAMVELIVLLPVLLVLVLGALDLGRMYYSKIVITNAAREGANYLSRNPSDKTSYNGTWSAIEAEGQGSGVTLVRTDVDWANTGCCNIGEPISIKVSMPVSLIFGTLLQSLGIVDGPITLSSSVNMVVQ